MKLNNSNAEFFIPDQLPFDQAISRTTHMSIGAHPDDLEIMSYDGILKCYDQIDKWFMGVIVTNGAGSARNGVYKDYSDLEMQIVRKTEQKKASKIGRFGSLTLLDYTSAEAKNLNNKVLIRELTNLISLAKPKVIYTHNFVDKHSTHIAVAIKTVLAIRNLDKKDRPDKLYGCEVWRGLDWMSDKDKVSFDVSRHQELAQQLIRVFDSQIAGGKRYDLATMGRRLSNATYLSSHTIDEASSIIYAMDMTPLIEDDNLDIYSFVMSFINRFYEEVSSELKKVIE